MGLFDKIRNIMGATSNTSDYYANPDFDAGLWRKMSNDTEYQRLIHEYYNMCGKIEETYSVINSMNAFDKPAGDTFIRLCRKTIGIVENLYPKWEMYNQVPFACDIYKRLSMAYEKRGEYRKSANVCLEAINIGFKSDGTNGGYLGRMVRMLKKGKLEPTEDMKRILSKMFDD